VKAPYIPKVKNSEDYSLIDPEFLEEVALIDKLHDQPETTIERNAGADAEIPNFQFINPKVLTEYASRQQNAINSRIKK
jgi:hypothetical protein